MSPARKSEEELREAVASNLQCNCPRGSYHTKHTAECYEAQIARLQADVYEMQARAAAAIWLVPDEKLCGDLLKLREEFKARLSPETPASHIDAFLALALPRIAELMKAAPEDATPEGCELTLLAELADQYEKQKYPEFRFRKRTRRRRHRRSQA